jgi:hypothetical protein
VWSALLDEKPSEIKIVSLRKDILTTAKLATDGEKCKMELTHIWMDWSRAPIV